MDSFEKFCQVEWFVLIKFIESGGREPHAMTTPLTEQRFLVQLGQDRFLQKLFTDMTNIYSEAHSAGFRLEPDSFGGYKLVNRSGKTIKPGEIDATVWLLTKKPKGREVDEWSLMDGEKLLVGVARWANHSCKANCDFYMGRGFNGRECVRLRALKEIHDREELLCFYNEHIFGENNVYCLCGHTECYGESIEEEPVEIPLPALEANRLRKMNPRIKITPVDIPKGVLSNLFNFYDEGSNAISFTSVESSIDLEYPVALPSGDQSVSDVSLDEFFFWDDAWSSVSLASRPLSPYRSKVCTDESDTQFSQEETDTVVCSNYSGRRLKEVEEVSPNILAPSLLAIAAEHKAPDSLLADLLKRDQILFGCQSISPWTVKTMLSQFYAIYESKKQIVENGEILWLNFRAVLIQIAKFYRWNHLVRWNQNRIEQY